MNSNNPTYQTPNVDTSWDQLRQTVQDQADLIRSLQVKACQCHIIDPAKIRILLWINRSKTGKPETATLKIGEQRLLGLPRSDRRGESYWRFDEIIEKAPESPEPIKCYQCQKEVPETKIPCWECKAEMRIVGELDESAPLVCENCLKKKASQTKTQESPAKEEVPSSEPKSKRQEFKEAIAQAVQENQQAELKENATP